MSSGERPIGAAKGKQRNTEASCQPPPPPPGGGTTRGAGGRTHLLRKSHCLVWGGPTNFNTGPGGSGPSSLPGRCALPERVAVRQGGPCVAVHLRRRRAGGWPHTVKRPRPQPAHPQYAN